MKSPDMIEGGQAAGFVAFAGTTLLAVGTAADVASAAKRALAEDHQRPVLVFNRTTGEVVDLDLRGSEAEIVARHAQPAASAGKRGRPRLGVVAREVTLLPRHWEWLASQPGGASVALRKLVEAARKLEGEEGAERRRVEAAYRFMSAMAGDLAGFEEAARALFARDHDRLNHGLQDWPPDIRDQVLGYLNAQFIHHNLV